MWTATPHLKEQKINFTEKMFIFKVTYNISVGKGNYVIVN